MANQLKQITIPATAGNVAAEVEVPDNMTYELLWGQISLTTDATVADRRVLMALVDPDSNVVFDIHAGASVPASSTNFHHDFMKGIFRETAFISDSIQVPIPFDAILPSGWLMRISIINGVAGDSFEGGGMMRAG